MTAVPFRSYRVAPELEARLEALAQRMREDNPQYTFLVDAGVVWLRHEGVDYGYYSATIDGKICECVSGGVTMVSRKVPAGGVS